MIYRVKTRPWKDPKTGKTRQVPAYTFIGVPKDRAGEPGFEGSPLVGVMEIDDRQWDITGQEHKLTPEPPIYAEKRGERAREEGRQIESPENRGGGGKSKNRD